MLILLIHLFLAAVPTVLYGLYGTPPAGFPGVLAFAGVFLAGLVAGFLLLVLFLIVVMIGFKRADPRGMFKHNLLYHYSRYYYLILQRVRLVATGLENVPKDNNFVMYSNHIEAHDPMYIKMLYRHAPMAFLSKEVLFKQFLVGSFLVSMGCIPISPGADRSALNSILEAIKRLKGGQPFGIFPEGRRTYSHDIITFRPGAFKVAVKAGADISPVCVYGMHEIHRKGRILPCTVRVHVFPLIKAADCEGLDTVAIAQRVEALVRDQLSEFKRLHPTSLEKA